jgi:hypothetical protein
MNPNYYGNTQNVFPLANRTTAVGTYTSRRISVGSTRQLAFLLTVTAITNTPTADIYVDLISPQNPSITTEYAKLTATPITLLAGTMTIRILGQTDLAEPGVVGEVPNEFQVRLVIADADGAATCALDIDRLGST